MFTELLEEGKSLTNNVLKAGAFLAATLPSLALLDSQAIADEQTVVASQKVEINAESYVSSGQDFIAKWDQGSQLFIKGDVALKPEQVKEINKFLAEHPNWSVFLDASAKTEEYRGQNGFKALDNLIKEGLVETSRFAENVVGQSEQPNSAILVITFDQDLAQRKVAYYSSTAQNQAGVGFSNWTGNLDRLAIQPLKQGRDVVGAVKATISKIDQDVIASKNPIEAETDWSTMLVIGGAVAAAAGVGYLMLRSSNSEEYSQYEPPSSGSRSENLVPAGSGGGRSGRSLSAYAGFERDSKKRRDPSRSSYSSDSQSRVDNSNDTLTNYLIMDNLLNNNSRPSSHSDSSPASSNDYSSGGGASSWSSSNADSSPSYDSGSSFDSGSSMDCGGADSGW